MKPTTETKSFTIEPGLWLSLMAMIDLTFNLPTLGTVTLFLMGVFGLLALALNSIFFFNIKMRDGYKLTRNPTNAFAYPLICVIYAFHKDATVVMVINTLVLMLPLLKVTYSLVRD